MKTASKIINTKLEQFDKLTREGNFIKNERAALDKEIKELMADNGTAAMMSLDFTAMITVAEKKRINSKLLESHLGDKLNQFYTHYTSKTLKVKRTQA